MSNVFVGMLVVRVDVYMDDVDVTLFSSISFTVLLFYITFLGTFRVLNTGISNISDS